MHNQGAILGVTKLLTCNTWGSQPGSGTAVCKQLSASKTTASLPSQYSKDSLYVERNSIQWTWWGDRWGWVGRLIRGPMNGQHMSALAIKVGTPLLDGYNNWKQLTFMGCIVLGAPVNFFAIIGDMAATCGSYPSSTHQQTNNLMHPFPPQSHHACWAGQEQVQEHNAYFS